jgi:hypothetical protein
MLIEVSEGCKEQTKYSTQLVYYNNVQVRHTNKRGENPQ